MAETDSDAAPAWRTIYKDDRADMPVEAYDRAAVRAGGRPPAAVDEPDDPDRGCSGVRRARRRG